MNEPSAKFELKGTEVFVHGYPELKGRKGIYGGMAWHSFLVKGGIIMKCIMYIANTSTGKIRKLSTTNGDFLVGDCEINFEAIAQKCEHGMINAKSKAKRYANRLGVALLEINLYI